MQLAGRIAPKSHCITVFLTLACGRSQRSHREKTTGSRGAAASAPPACRLRFLSVVNHLPVSALCHKNSRRQSSYLPQHRHQWPLSPERSTTACHLQVLQRDHNSVEDATMLCFTAGRGSTDMKAASLGKGNGANGSNPRAG